MDYIFFNELLKKGKEGKEGRRKSRKKAKLNISKGAQHGKLYKLLHLKRFEVVFENYARNGTRQYLHPSAAKCTFVKRFWRREPQPLKQYSCWITAFPMSGFWLRVPFKERRKFFEFGVFSDWRDSVPIFWFRIGLLKLMRATANFKFPMIADEVCEQKRSGLVWNQGSKISRLSR